MIAIIALLIISSLIIAYFGRHRKFGFWGYFFASVFFSPLLGLLLLVASEKHAPKRSDE